MGNVWWIPQQTAFPEENVSIDIGSTKTISILTEHDVTKQNPSKEAGIDPLANFDNSLIANLHAITRTFPRGTF